jgi:hypothetical protein
MDSLDVVKAIILEWKGSGIPAYIGLASKVNVVAYFPPFPIQRPRSQI